jgi:ABC-type multidrug transport system ATPase subunit
VSSGSVEVRHFTKTYGPVQALSDVSLSVHDGKVLGLIGPNGAGKTTLFECLAGEIPADRGEIVRDGHHLSAGERTTTIFYLPDAIAPWPAETVGWSLDFAAGYFGGPPGRRDEVIAQLQLEPLLRTRIGALSKGQRKRAVRSRCCWWTSPSTAWTCVRRGTSAVRCGDMPPADAPCSSRFIRSATPRACAIASSC